MSWLNEDLTKSETADHFLKECINSKKVIPSGSALQISQCINISFPRKNKEADDVHHDSKKSVIRIILTDGKNSIPALLTESHPQLSSSTFPGTKIEITQDIPVVLNFIILTAHNVRILGGTVPAMVEQWKMQTASENLKCWDFRFMNNVKDGPPLWKPFSKRGSSIDASALRNVKAMDIVKEQKESQKTSDDPSKSKFDAQRQEVISELTKQSQRKSFGEGKRLVDKGILDIVNEGFTEEEAEEALRKFKNPQKALKYLKGNVRSRDSNIARLREAEKEKELLGDRGGGRKGGRKDREDDGPTGNEIGEQPSNSINLFGFIEQKMKKDTGNDSAPTTTGKQQEQDTEPQKYFSGNYDNTRSGRGTSKNSYSEDRGYHRGGHRGHSNRGRGGGYDRSDNEDNNSRHEMHKPNHGGSGSSNSFRGFRSDRWDSLSSQSNSNQSEFRRGDNGGYDGDAPRDQYQQRRTYDSDRQHQKADRSHFASTSITSNRGFSRPSTAPQQDSGGMNRQHKNSQVGEFDGLKASNFPSLIDEPPSRFNTASANPSHSRPISQVPHDEYKYGEPKDHYRSSGDDNSNYGRQHQQQREDKREGGGYYRPPQQQQQQQQSFQPRSGHYDNYERNKRMPQQSNDRQWNSGSGGPGYRPERGYNQQFNQQFSSLSMQQQQPYSQGEGHPEDWRPSHTMVFVSKSFKK